MGVVVVVVVLITGMEVVVVLKLLTLIKLSCLVLFLVTTEIYGHGFNPKGRLSRKHRNKTEHIQQT